jgi:pseudouridine kinase
VAFLSRVVVVGGSVIDLFLYPHQKMHLYDSNPGYMKKSLGGVGRNIAENLARLQIPTTLITPLGQDGYQNMILDQAKQIGLNILPIEIKETPLYVSIINEGGEDLIGVALMDEITSIKHDDITKYHAELDQAELIVLDTNLSEDLLGYLLKTYAHKTYVDAISGQKASKLKPFLKDIHTLKMNFIEAKTIAGFGEDSFEGLDALGQFFIDQGVKEIFLTLGEKGVYYASHDMAMFRSSVPIKVINSTGAGDAFFAGVIYATIHKKDLVSYGIGNACLNLIDEHAVALDLSDQKLEETIEELNL